MLYAGWQVDGEPQGAPNDGYFPVPAQLLRAVGATTWLQPCWRVRQFIRTMSDRFLMKSRFDRFGARSSVS